MFVVLLLVVDILGKDRITPEDAGSMLTVGTVQQMDVFLG